MPGPLRLTSVMGVARALLATISIEDAVDILIGEFGWDATFQACSLLRGEDAADAFAACWVRLLTEPIASELRHGPRLSTEFWHETAGITAGRPVADDRRSRVPAVVAPARSIATQMLENSAAPPDGRARGRPGAAAERTESLVSLLGDQRAAWSSTCSGSARPPSASSPTSSASPRSPRGVTWACSPTRTW